MVSLKMSWKPKFLFNRKRLVIAFACYRGPSPSAALAQSYENVAMDRKMSGPFADEQDKRIRVQVNFLNYTPSQNRLHPFQ